MRASEPLNVLWKAPCGQAPGRHGGEEGEEEEGEEEVGEEEEGLHLGLQLCPAPSLLEPTRRAAPSSVRSPARGRSARSSLGHGGDLQPPSPASPNSNKSLPFFLSGCKEEQES